MAVNAFVSFFDKTDGESTQKGKEKWVEVETWDWEVAAESSWSKGGGASVGKPNPGKLTFAHHFDISSIVMLGYICTGKAFPKMQLEVMQTGPRGTAETFFTMTLEGVFITKVFSSGIEDGQILQKVEMVFKTIKIEYKPHDARTGALGAAKTFNWDIPAGTASPSA